MSLAGDRNRDRAILAAIFLIALGVRLYGLDFKPYWLDEVYTAKRSGLPFGELVTASFFTGHPPTYFLLIAPLERFGVGEFLLRAPSVLFGALACPVVAAIANRLAGRMAAAMAGLLVALSPVQVIFSQEARSYALITLLIAVALHGLIRLALDPRAAAFPLRHPDAAKGAWATFLVATAVAMDTEGTALLWMIAAAIALIVIGWQNREARPGLARNALIVYGVMAVSILPCYAALFALAPAQRPVLHALNWIVLTEPHVFRDLASLYFFQICSPVTWLRVSAGVPLIGLAIAALSALGIANLWRRPAILATLTITAVTAPPALFAVSLIHNYWVLRYLLWSAVPFFVIAGVGVALLPRRGQIAIIPVFGLLGLINLAPDYRTETKPRWDLAAALLRPAVAHHDLILFDKSTLAPTVFNFYLAGTDAMETRSTAMASARIAAGGRVWAVHGRGSQVEFEDFDAFSRRVAILGKPAETLRAGAEIIILRFDPPARK